MSGMADDNGRGRRVVILYGSQTGTAQAVSERIYRESKRLHFETKLSSMDDFQPISQLLEERCIVFVAATTGQGDEPDNMNRFWKFLLRKNLPRDSLDGLNFAVLGLGDSSYQKFNFVAKRLHKRLLQLGAEAMVDLGLGDDQHDLGPDAVIDPWLINFWNRALELMPLPTGLTPISKTVTPPPKYNVIACNQDDINDRTDISDNIAAKCFENGSSAMITHDENAPFLAPLIGCQRQTAADHFQDTRLVEFDVSGSSAISGSGYKPGDVCMVRPGNLRENVDTFFELFPALDRQTVIKLERNSDLELPPASVLPPRFTLQECVERLWDIQAIPGRYFFELLSHFSPSADEDGLLEKEKLIELSTAEGQQELYDYCNRPRRNILEVLYDFRHTTPRVPLQYLFDLFPVIKPRAFSIASSWDADPNRIQLLVAVVHYKSKRLKAPRLGLCSNWLTRLEPGKHKVPIWIKPGTFKFPAEKPPPVVMVGPGTGIAPFRAYARQQLTLKSERPMAIFFGCRGRHKDHYFKEEWSQMAAGSNLEYHPVFSRDDPDSDVIYVQHKMAANSERLFELVFEQKAWFYIAGNAKQMPDQVTDALKDALKKHGPFDGSQDQVNQYVAKMEASKRFQTETWS